MLRRGKSSNAFPVFRTFGIWNFLDRIRVHLEITANILDAYSRRMRGGIQSEPYALVTLCSFNNTQWIRRVEKMGEAIRSVSGWFGGGGAGGRVLESSKAELFWKRGDRRVLREILLEIFLVMDQRISVFFNQISLHTFVWWKTLTITLITDSARYNPRKFKIEGPKVAPPRAIEIPYKTFRRKDRKRTYSIEFHWN